MSEETLTVRVPLAVRKRGGRKVVRVPDGSASWTPQQARVDAALVKALARAFQWRNLLETGVYGNIGEIAAAEKVNTSYVSRVLRMTLLAPKIVETILESRHRAGKRLGILMQPFGLGWEEQCQRFAPTLESG